MEAAVTRQHRLFPRHGRGQGFNFPQLHGRRPRSSDLGLSRSLGFGEPADDLARSEPRPAHRADDARVEAGEVPRPPAKRACSIFRHRFITAARPAAAQMAAASTDHSPSCAESVRLPSMATTSSAPAGRPSGRRNTSTRSGTPGSSASERVHRLAEHLASARVDEPHMVERATRGQQVGPDEVARPMGSGDTPTIAMLRVRRRIARRCWALGSAGAGWSPDVVVASWVIVPSSPLPAPGRDPTGCGRGLPGPRTAGSDWRGRRLRPVSHPRVGGGGAGRMDDQRPRVADVGRWLQSSTDSMIRRAAARPPRTPNASTAPGPSGGCRWVRS